MTSGPLATPPERSRATSIIARWDARELLRRVTAPATVIVLGLVVSLYGFVQADRRWWILGCLVLAGGFGATFSTAMTMQAVAGEDPPPSRWKRLGVGAVAALAVIALGIVAPSIDAGSHGDHATLVVDRGGARDAVPIGGSRVLLDHREIIDLAAGTRTDPGLGQEIVAVGDDALVLGDRPVLVTARGEPIWRSSEVLDELTPEWRLLPLAAADGVVVLAGTTTRSDDAFAVAIDEAGDVVWRRDDVGPTAGGSFGRGIGEWSRLPAELARVAVVAHAGEVDGDEVDEPDHGALDPATGDELVRHRGSTAPLAAVGDVVVWTGLDGTDDRCPAWATRGDDELWRADVPCSPNGLPASSTSGERAIYWSSSGFVLVELATGRWAPVTGDVAASTRAFVSRDADDPDVLVATDPYSGAERWRFDASAPHGEPPDVQAFDEVVVVRSGIRSRNPMISNGERSSGFDFTVLDVLTGDELGWVRCGGHAAGPAGPGLAVISCGDGSLHDDAVWIVGRPPSAES